MCTKQGSVRHGRASEHTLTVLWEALGRTGWKSCPTPALPLLPLGPDVDSGLVPFRTHWQPLSGSHLQMSGLDQVN